MNRRRIIFLVLAIIWMGVIFLFSSRDGDESADDSYEVGYAVGKLVVPDFEEMPEEEQLEFVSKVDYPVRKTAHATEYAVLAALLIGALISGTKRENCRLYMIFPWLIATMYAALDEFHQTFVPGRDGNPIDVCIDSLGAIIGSLIAICIVFIIERLTIKSQVLK